MSFAAWQGPEGVPDPGGGPRGQGVHCRQRLHRRRRRDRLLRRLPRGHEVLRRWQVPQHKGKFGDVLLVYLSGSTLNCFPLRLLASMRCCDQHKFTSGEGVRLSLSAAGGC